MQMQKLSVESDALIGAFRQQSANCDSIIRQVRDLQLCHETARTETRVWLARAAEKHGGGAGGFAMYVCSFRIIL